MIKYLLLFTLCLNIKAVEVFGMFSAYKEADQSVTSSTTLADDNTLTKAIDASGIYGFEIYAPFNLAGIVSGYKFAINGPASPTTVSYQVKVDNTSALTTVVGPLATALDSALAGALASTGDHICRIVGTIENGANSGNLVLRFAQNTSDGSAIKIKRGAWMKVWRIK